MAKANANGIQIEYETFGDSNSPPLLLIRGLGTQMTDWEEDFCNQFVKKGFFVIRFDNRDVGLSQKFEECGVPDVMAALTALMQGQEIQPPYSLEDMADDAVGLLDTLGIKKAHILGISMGSDTIIKMGNRILTTILEKGSARFEWAHQKHDPARPFLTELSCSLIHIPSPNGTRCHTGHH